MPKVIDCTTIAWVQEKAKLNVKANREKPVTKKANNDNITEVVSGIMIAIIFVGLPIIGLFV